MEHVLCTLPKFGTHLIFCNACNDIHKNFNILSALQTYRLLYMHGKPRDYNISGLFQQIENT